MLPERLWVQITSPLGKKFTINFMSFNKKHILVLGGSSDIGFEVIKNLLSLDYKVSAHYFKNNNNLLKLRNNNLSLIKLDFTNFNNSKIDKIIKSKFNGKYDSIINLVGYIDNKSFQSTNLKSIIKSIISNAIIPILIQRNAIKHMLSKNWGRILNCSSIGVKFGGGKNSYNYSLSKHSLEFIPNEFKFWATKNVLINNLRIGVTNTKIHKRMKKNLNLKKRIKLIPMKRMAEANEISKYIVNLASEENSFITGETITVAGGE